MEDLFYLYDTGFTWVFIVFAFCWGLSGLINDWDGFESKLINSLAIIGSIVLFILAANEEDFLSALGMLAGGAAALWIGGSISADGGVDNDWESVLLIIGLLAFIAMFVLFGIWA